PKNRDPSGKEPADSVRRRPPRRPSSAPGSGCGPAPPPPMLPGTIHPGFPRFLLAQEGACFPEAELKPRGVAERPMEPKDWRQVGLMEMPWNLRRFGKVTNLLRRKAG